MFQRFPALHTASAQLGRRRALRTAWPVSGGMVGGQAFGLYAKCSGMKPGTRERSFNIPVEIDSTPGGGS